MEERRSSEGSFCAASSINSRSSGKSFSVGRATTNSHGLRDVERQFEKKPGVKRIILLGDSVVEGINYVDDNETIARQLETQFAGQQTEVLNLGTAGYCTQAEVELLKMKGLRYRPDFVLHVFTPNDFQNFNPEHTLEGTIWKQPLAQWNCMFDEANEVEEQEAKLAADRAEFERLKAVTFK